LILLSRASFSGVVLAFSATYFSALVNNSLVALPFLASASNVSIALSFLASLGLIGVSFPSFNLKS